MILIVVAFFYFGTYTRKSTAAGLLIPEQGVLRIASSGAGVISEIHTVEGMQVEAGDTIFVISNERASTSGATQHVISEHLAERASLLEKNIALIEERSSQQLRILENRKRAATEEKLRLQEEYILIKRRVELASANLIRHKDLASKNFVSKSQLQQAEAELLTLQGQQHTLRRAEAALTREKDDILLEQQQTQLRRLTEIFETNNSIALIKQEQAENDMRTEHVNTAPFKGTITGISVQHGQQVMTGSLLASLIPYSTELTAHVYVAPAQAGFIEPGQVALMRYAAYPYQKSGMAKGRVLHVAPSPYAIQELPPHIAGVLTGQGEELFYRVTIKPESQSLLVYGTPQPLRAGSILEVDIIQDRRRLYEWALEPIYSITGKSIN
ncbi:HlyD family secretion protein [Cellvibrio polysaccharolyticus]|uniref:HlyD family efflux transporter periplasmic adaptor subunit n=1 Tax=Cellvibrio polysaccharolyticus TaxID=2082724 RepID=A0A928V7X1_9GAMM|nr:HlyD family efflux transporter periplasmic adaptor subunit [Cellvibrio polysaccharolyticus]MBE8718760.1 HlyD family efflux transporter periplasmic adaptor subunit [Cellvibrio polysaccharolyticus]